MCLVNRELSRFIALWKAMKANSHLEALLGRYLVRRDDLEPKQGAWSTYIRTHIINNNSLFDGQTLTHTMTSRHRVRLSRDHTWIRSHEFSISSSNFILDKLRLLYTLGKTVIVGYTMYSGNTHKNITFLIDSIPWMNCDNVAGHRPWG